MRSCDAKYTVIEHLEREGWVVYARLRDTVQKAIGSLVAYDPNTSMLLSVRVLVGKRPPRSKTMLRDRAREGSCDVVAYVDPKDGRVCLRMPLPAGKHDS